MKEEIYLDNAATTKPFTECIDIFNKVSIENYGNPSSLHILGVDAENIEKKCKEKISKILNCYTEELYLTSSATESNNILIKGVSDAYKREGNHIITTKIEHPSVKNTIEFLKNNGFCVDYIDVDKNGLIDLLDLKSKLTCNTILVSIIHASNEIGIIQPIKEVVDIVKEYNEKIIIHSDMTQSLGKIDLDLKNINVDLASFSAHKIHSVKGAGLLYKKENIRLNSIISGGGQEKNIRSGTQNIAALVSFSKAIEILCDKLSDNTTKYLKFKNIIIDGIYNLSKKYNTKINVIGDKESHNNIKIFLPNILSIYFENIRSEVMLHALEEYNIYVSSGSACSSNYTTVDNILNQIKLEQYNKNMIRISMGVYTNENDIYMLLKAFDNIIPMLNKYIRK